MRGKLAEVAYGHKSSWEFPYIGKSNPPKQIPLGNNYFFEEKNRYYFWLYTFYITLHSPIGPISNPQSPLHFSFSTRGEGGLETLRQKLSAGPR